MKNLSVILLVAYAFTWSPRCLGHPQFSTKSQNDTTEAVKEMVIQTNETSSQNDTEKEETSTQFPPIWLQGNESDTKITQQQQHGKKDDEEDEAVVEENEYGNLEEIIPLEQLEQLGEIILEQDELENEEFEDDEIDDDDGEDDVMVLESAASNERLLPDHMQNESNTEIHPDHVDVEVKEWHEPMQTLASTSENAIDSANSVSAPWYDVMAMGLPPSVAYNWQFLMDLSGKLRTAPRSIHIQNRESSNDSGEYNARLKYLLTHVQDIQSSQSLPVKLDNLKQQHLLKTKLTTLNNNGDDDILAWAWRRAVPLQ